MRKGRYKRIGAVLLSISLVFSSLQVNTLAAETGANEVVEQNQKVTEEASAGESNEEASNVVTELETEKNAETETEITTETSFEVKVTNGSIENEAYVLSYSYDTNEKTIEITKIETQTGIDNNYAVVIPEIVEVNGESYSVIAIGNNAFEKNTKLAQITLPDTITKIGDYAFNGCKNLIRLNSDEDGVVNLPAGLSSIGIKSFSACNQFVTVNIGANLTSDTINGESDGPFLHCEGIKTITFAEGTTTIIPNMFRGSIHTNESVETADEVEFVIPETVTTIGKNAFQHQYNLLSITLPESLEEIGDYAFLECENLKRMNSEEDRVANLPASLSSIGIKSFSGCNKFEKVNIGANLTSDTINGESDGPFFHCEGIRTITFAEDTTTIIPNMFRGSIHTNESSETADEVEFVIPDTVTTIGKDAFRHQFNLLTIKLPKSVKTIGDRAFYESPNLSTLVIPYGVTSIGTEALTKATGLKKLYMPSTVTNTDSEKSLAQLKTNQGILYVEKGDSQAKTDAESLGITYEVGIFCAENEFEEDSLKTKFAGYAYDTNQDTRLDLEELAQVETIDIKNLELQKLTGMELFVNLKELDCSKNKLVKIDISVFEKLEVLNCEENQINTIDLSANAKLKTVYVGKNQLIMLDRSANPDLDTVTGADQTAVVSSCKVKVKSGSDTITAKKLLFGKTEATFDRSKITDVKVFDQDNKELTPVKNYYFEGVETDKKQSLYVDPNVKYISYTYDSVVSAVVEITDYKEDEDDVDSVELVATPVFIKTGKETLKNVALSNSEWKWAQENTLLEASSIMPVQYFTAEYQVGNITRQKIVPVYITKITGVTLTGASISQNTVKESTIRKVLQKGQSASYQVVLNYIGYYNENDKIFLEELDKAVSYQWKLGSKLTTTDEKNKKYITVTATDVSTKAAEKTIQLTMSYAGKEYETSQVIDIVTNYISDLEIIPSQAAANAIAYGVEKGNYQGITIEKGNLVTSGKEKHNAVKLSAYGVKNGQKLVLNKNEVTWTVTDPSVASVAQSADGTALLTIKGAGTTVISAVAKDAAKENCEYCLSVLDYTPYWEQKSFMINKYYKSGIELPIMINNGNTIEEIQISGTVSQKDTTLIQDYIRIEKNAKNNQKYELFVKNDKAKDLKTKLVLRPVIKVKTKNNTTYEETITVTIDVTSPSSKIAVKKVTDANLFYADTTAKYTFTSKYAIDSISVGKKRDGFYLINPALDSNRMSGSLEFCAGNLKSTIDQYKNAAVAKELTTVEITFNWKDYVPTTYTMKVSTKNVAPKLKMLDYYPYADTLTGYVTLYDLTSKCNIAFDNSITVSKNQGNITIVGKQAEDGKLEIKMPENIASAACNYKLEVKHANWTKSLIASGKIAKKASPVVYANGKKSIKLSLSKTMVRDDVCATAGLTCNNDEFALNPQILYESSSVKKMTKEIANTYIGTQYDSEQKIVKFWLKTGANTGLTAGTYSYRIKCGDQCENPVVILQVIDGNKAPKVSLSAKQYINLLDRTNTYVDYKITVSNTSAKVKSVILTGEQACYFQIRDPELMSQGIVRVSAKSAYNMRAKDKYYKLGMKFVFADQTETSEEIKLECENIVVPIRNQAPKYTTVLSGATIYKAANNQLVWKVTNDKDYAISNISITSNPNSKYFKVIANKNEQDQYDGTVTLSLTEEGIRKCKKGSYKVKVEVSLAGQGIDVKSKEFTIICNVKE